MKRYAVWELRTHSLIRDFDSERDALALVREAIELNGPEVVEHLSLDVEDEQGEGYLIAHGQELAERALREFAAARISGEFHLAPPRRHHAIHAPHRHLPSCHSERSRGISTWQRRGAIPAAKAADVISSEVETAK